MKKNKIYFASDFHLGSNNIKESQIRERLIIEWLNQIKINAKDIYLLGDIFDFWFEYKKVVPKGCTRLLGKLAELNDSGITIHIITGNHDLWMKEYLKEEIGALIYHNNIIIHEQDKKILIGHGDGLGKGDYLYKLLSLMFNSKLCQWLFSLIHPNLALSIAHKWSEISRNKNKQKKEANEILFDYCKEKQIQYPVNYYIFGHTHTPVMKKIDNNSTYINTGDWISHNTYVELYQGKAQLKEFIIKGI